MDDNLQPDRHDVVDAEYEARKILLSHSNSFYGPLKDMRCGCQECRVIRALLAVIDELRHVTAPPDLRTETIRKALRALDREAVSAHHLPVALAALDSLTADLTRWKNACLGTQHEVEQILGRALGYPKYPEDWYAGDDACVGDHVPESLASEAASRLVAAETRLAAAQQERDRLLSIAQHLYAMVPQSEWRMQGADDMQGHYEGDYHAEQIREELAALADTPKQDGQP